MEMGEDAEDNGYQGCRLLQMAVVVLTRSLMRPLAGQLAGREETAGRWEKRKLGLATCAVSFRPLDQLWLSTLILPSGHRMKI
jgi:hypothetical protein